MITFILNGNKVSAPAELKLIDYLRDEARLTSVKNWMCQRNLWCMYRIN